jgi:hypothetical protein
LAWLEQFSALELSTEEQKAPVYARKTGRVDNAAFRSPNSYISPLVREGRLQPTGAPNDPNAAYRAAHQPGAEL